MEAGMRHRGSVPHRKPGSPSPPFPRGTGGRRHRAPSPPGTKCWRRPSGTVLQAPPEVFMRMRLAHNIQWWRDAGACRRVLRNISHGVKLEFQRRPQPFAPRNIPVPDKWRDWVHAELDRATALGTYETATCFDFIAPAFIIEQRNKLRLVIDFTSINACCVDLSCRYEGLRDIKHIMQPNDWMLSLDLTDAYWHVPIASEHRKYLTFQVDGRILQCAALPFGWKGSPLNFTKVVRAFVRYLRSRGIRCLPYLDDIAFFISGSYDRALRARQVIEEALEGAALSRKPSKGVWEPTHRLPDHLGMCIDSVAGTFTAPARRCNAVAGAARALLAAASRSCRRVCSARLRSFAGAASSLSLALHSARFRLRSVFDCLERRRPLSILSRQAVTDLQWWASLHARHPENGLPIWPPSTARTLWCDASGTTGWGAQLQGGAEQHVASGYWRRGDEAALHITHKELKTLRLSLAALLQHVRGQHVLLWEDNMAVVHIVMNGTSRSPALMTELRQLWSFLAEHRITLCPRYIRSSDNPADFWSRWRDRSAWQLDPALFLQLQLRWGITCSLDAFACRATYLLPRFCSARPDPRAWRFDAFTVPWGSELLWLNPPWELIPRVLFKLREERARGIIIVPHWPSQAWWPTLMELAVRVVNLPRPRQVVRPAHDGVVEPLLHAGLRLRAVLVDGSGGGPRSPLFLSALAGEVAAAMT
uniref:Reverse transcriptase domain-containing protein n=1 Tax=Hemiselmis tepida TaxID=464990 RepID=A0A7S0Z4Q6_9CRYP|mmetsp:Transcript_8815/g.22970  ORF Transcript_8815/g.22970 Transcript_8815/m.22970 type:complete len:705 (+) Transcript_8815:281-2395(+)